MKFVDCHALARINTFLDHVNVGDSIVCGSLEAYSCRKYGSTHGQFAARGAHQIVCAGKLTGLDKQLSKSLDVEVQNDTPTAELATSPVGPLSEPSSRKTLVYLILTLNQCFPDYDFSQLRARHFQKEESPTSVEPIIDSHLLQVSKVWELNPRYGSGKFLDALWASIDEACDLADCDVYSYRKDSNADVDPFSERSAIWSFTYFFYNRRLKRIVFFSCRSLPTLAVERAGTPGASSTPTVSQVTGDRVQRATVEPESDSEIVGGMDDV